MASLWINVSFNWHLQTSKEVPMGRVTYTQRLTSNSDPVSDVDASCWFEVRAAGHSISNLPIFHRLSAVQGHYIQRSPPSSICMDIFTVPVYAQQQYNLFLSAVNMRCRRKQVVLLLDMYRDCQYVHTNGRRRGSLVESLSLEIEGSPLAPVTFSKK